MNAQQRPEGICGDCGQPFDPTTPGARALRTLGIRVCPHCIHADDREIQECRRLRGDKPIDGRY